MTRSMSPMTTAYASDGGPTQSPNPPPAGEPGRLIALLSL